MNSAVRRARRTPAGAKAIIDDGRKRVVIEGVTPEVDCGRFPAKRIVGDTVAVEADIFTDGHDQISGVLRYRRADEAEWREVPLAPLVNDRWRGHFTVDALGRWVFTVEAWVDHFLTWHRDLKKRVAAGQDVDLQLVIGAQMIEAAAGRAGGEDRTHLRSVLAELQGEGSTKKKLDLILPEEILPYMSRSADRSLATTYTRELELVVDPVKARFSSWYELFPRSAGAPNTHGTFRDVEARLPYVASLGFDVLYLPPIHPVGRSFRKGKNNATTAEPDDVGSPWAIGAAEGGHTSILPELGSLEDFEHMVAAARQRRIDIALDVAFQVAPDHPWVKEHPEWFLKRPDGTIQYAENPPKKYEDIYPFNFETEAWEELWTSLREVFLYWISKGVRIFRVDNPHTKALAFWEWAIAGIKREHPDVIFLAEAFTRPKLMYRLAKAGFTQSYTYFAWRNAKWDLTEYFTELNQTGVREFFRPNAWPNTPDILTEQLQFGGRAAFMCRLVLAATLSANYGIYGPAFELMEHVARHHGSEEYLHSEKYQIRNWNLDDPDSLAPFIARVNRIRHGNTALQQDHTLRFHETSNENLICYSKVAPDRSNVILTVVNLDFYNRHGGFVDLNLSWLGLSPDQGFQVHDLLTGARYGWRGARNYVELDPHVVPAHVFEVQRTHRTEQDFETYYV
jgi:starch synthase (maltosyl-transferring)